jgi:hypothetical protein
VLQIFTTRLEEEILKLPITTPLGKTRYVDRANELKCSASARPLTGPNLDWNRLQADMAYFGQKLGQFDANGVIGSRLIRQVKELDLSDKKSGTGTAAVATASDKSNAGQ